MDLDRAPLRREPSDFVGGGQMHAFRQFLDARLDDAFHGDDFWRTAQLICDAGW
jgi:hypothetical protein